LAPARESLTAGRLDDADTQLQAMATYLAREPEWQSLLAEVKNARTQAKQRDQLTETMLRSRQDQVYEDFIAAAIERIVSAARSVRPAVVLHGRRGQVVFAAAAAARRDQERAEKRMLGHRSILGAACMRDSPRRETRISPNGDAGGHRG